MRTSLPSLVGLVVLVTACGKDQKLPERPKGFEDHLAAARQHEANAEAHARAAEQAENAPANYPCTDPVLNDQITSGTEQLTTWTPCWDIQWQAEVRHRRAAEREIEEARKDRQLANRLAATQRQYCRGLSARDLASSPVEHREAIVEVIPYAQGEVRGARILFRPVPGLTAERMAAAIACHQARFRTLGKPSTYLAQDPTVVDGARVTVRELPRGIEVFVASADPAAGLIIAARAQELGGPQTATR